MSRSQTGPQRLQKGFGAGTGAALTMIAAMALVRLGVGIPSIPELLQGVFLRLVPGEVFEFMIHLMGPGAKVLLLVSMLWGILLVGGLLGWAFAQLWRPAPAGAGAGRLLLAGRGDGGFLYGVGIGAALILAWMSLFYSGWMNPQPAEDVLLPVGISLTVYGIVYGLALVTLLPWDARPLRHPPPMADEGRRGFLRMAGGTLLALLAGAGLWATLTTLLREPEDAGVFAQDGAAPGPAGGGNTMLQNDLATAVAQNGPTDPSMATPAPTDTNTPIPAPSATETPIPSNTPVPTTTPIPAPSDTETPIPSNTPVAPSVVEAPPTDTPRPTDTPLPTDTPVPTATPVPTDTPTSTKTPTDTPRPTAPPTRSLTHTPVRPTPPVFPAVPLLPPEVTPTENFYLTTKNYADPDLDGGRWKLTIKGLVEHPLTLTLAQVKALPQVKVVHTLECISNTIGGTLIGNAVWTGVRVADLLRKAEPKPGAVDAIFRAADDYSDSVPAAILMDPDTMLVYEMNSQPLTMRHGYPARLLIPGIYGMKNVKWLTSIELVNYDYKGFWQQQGWSDPAPYQTHTRIDFPKPGNISQQPLYIGGNAFAGNRSIQRVEVSLDGGQTWADAQLRRPLGRNSWVFWTFPWIPTKPGNVTLVARATDGTGQVQPAADRNNYPNGATGYHRVRVKVVKA